MDCLVIVSRSDGKVAEHPCATQADAEVVVVKEVRYAFNAALSIDIKVTMDYSKKYNRKG